MAQQQNKVSTPARLDPPLPENDPRVKIAQLLVKELENGTLDIKWREMQKFSTRWKTPSAPRNAVKERIVWIHSPETIARTLRISLESARALKVHWPGKTNSPSTFPGTENAEEVEASGSGVYMRNRTENST